MKLNPNVSECLRYIKIVRSKRNTKKVNFISQNVRNFRNRFL